MMKIVSEKISLFFRRTFRFFSLLTLSFAVIGLLIKNNEYSKYIAADILISFFIFSALLAISFAISDLVKQNSILKGFIRFILSFASLSVVFFFGGAFNNYVVSNGVQNKGFSILAISFAFVIIYVLCSVISMIFGSISKRVSNSKAEYDNMFDNIK